MTMNKYLFYTFFILLCFGCKHPEKTKQQSGSGKPLAIRKENVNNKRSFKDFLIKFSSDSVYQINHVSFPIRIWLP